MHANNAVYLIHSFSRYLTNSNSYQAMLKLTLTETLPFPERNAYCLSLLLSDVIKSLNMKFSDKDAGASYGVTIVTTFLNTLESYKQACLSSVLSKGIHTVYC